MNLSNIVVCSFYTSDDYYRGHAASLRKNLERIGVAYKLEEIEKAPGEEWPDICRKKIGFLARVCDEQPDRKVFWIDVDCALLELPTYVAGFTADIIGFQRGFGSPMRIGYANRTRFWEPCFFGINTTPSARKFIHDAHLLEQSAEIKATDDYFFEESWRSNASRLSFQVIPSIAVISKAPATPQGVATFFSFGASGNVQAYKHKVKQHGRTGGTGGTGGTARVRRVGGMRHQALRAAKLIERRLPARAAASLRKIADNLGLTHVLTGGGLDADRYLPSGVTSPHRNRLINEMIMAGQRGEVSRVDQAFSRLASSGIPSESEIAAKRAADAFSVYASKNSDADPIRLAWWPRPFPGNFGDWLSPLVLDARTDRSVVYQSPTAPTSEPHIFSIGSIGRFIKPSSIVVGTGISSTDVELDRKARYISVRGPLTAELVQQCGGPNIESFGDPGALLSRIIPVERGLTNGRIALVRHHRHASLPTALADNMDELSVCLSHPQAIRSFVTELNGYDAVVTSAMHVMIICHSYGIPCCLITFEGFESAVHGSGIKYKDYALGAGLEAVYEPIPIYTDLRRVNFESMISKEKITESKLDEIEQAIAAGVSTYLLTSG
ncbi:polysaccharide pyruvyl transferase family protein [Actinopolymorpha sp. B11F2]|uniref:polysaccharide pyruvyl transferase family protein n=1 Tax=Actinopolymorpha sp. B11F2 TaxID=3160862 RepID=UPI0032E401D6